MIQTRLVPTVLLALLAPALASADVVQTKDGARLVGTVTAINAGAVTLSTSYAGDLTIKQSEVTSIQTDKPSSFRLASGTRIDGTVNTNAQGQVQVTGTDGTVTTTVSNVAMAWPLGHRDPIVGAWSYEATADVAGTSGNKESLATGASFTATLVNPKDTLKFYTAYNRAETEGVKSADQFKAGVDYSQLFAPDQQWFVRNEAGFDRIMDIRYYDVAAGGYGFDLVKTPQDTLLARIGLAYRYTDYKNPLSPTVSTAAGDAEINHVFNGPWFEVHNNLTFVPDFSDFADYLVTQDSFAQVPLKNTLLKFRVGVSNNYNSRPGQGIKKLDTLYYLRLVYDFGAGVTP